MFAGTLSSAVSLALNTDFYLEDLGMIRSSRANREILRRSQLFRLCPFLQAAFRVVNFFQYRCLRFLQQRTDKLLHGAKAFIQVDRADQRLKQRPQQSITLAAAGGKFTASKAESTAQLQAPGERCQLIIADNGR